MTETLWPKILTSNPPLYNPPQKVYPLWLVGDSWPFMVNSNSRLWVALVVRGCWLAASRVSPGLVFQPSALQARTLNFVSSLGHGNSACDGLKGAQPKPVA